MHPWDCIPGPTGIQYNPVTNSHPARHFMRRIRRPEYFSKTESLIMLNNKHKMTFISKLLFSHFEKKVENRFWGIEFFSL